MTDHEDSTGKEVARLVAHAEAAALGQLATREASPVVYGESQWTRLETGLQKELAGVHLGTLTGPEGWNAGYRDKAETIVPEAGIAVGVSQGSHGPTGLFAKPLKGYSVEAALLDPATNQVSWQVSPEENGEVKVDSDHGNLEDMPIGGLWEGTALGNPGTRAGLVKVTGPDSEARYYALGANFEGEPDNWDVQGGIIEVRPHAAQALPGQGAALPSGE